MGHYMEIDKGLIAKIAFPNAERIRLLSTGAMDDLWGFVSDYKLPHSGAYIFGVSEAYGIYSSGVNFEVVRDKFDIVYASISQFCNSSANWPNGSRQWGFTLYAIAFSEEDNIIADTAMEFRDALYKYGRECVNDPKKLYEKHPDKYDSMLLLEYLGHHEMVDAAWEQHGVSVKFYRQYYTKARPFMDKIFAKWKKLNSA